MSFLVYFGLVTKDWYEITAERILIKERMLPIFFSFACAYKTAHSSFIKISFLKNFEN